MSIDAQIVEVVRATVEQCFERLRAELQRSNELDERRDPQKVLYSETAAAALLSVSPLSLKKWRQDGLIRAHTQVKPILFSWSNIEAISEWLATRGVP